VPGGIATKRRKVFFFEKKKQKTFALTPSSLGAPALHLARSPTDKSFFLLFFKKEGLPSLAFSAYPGAIREATTMPSSFLYYLATAAESTMSIFGVRAPYEQPKYQVIGHIGDDVEIRAYPERVAAETKMRLSNDGEAFGRLFRYITGANHTAAKIAMTVPVEQSSQRIAMTIPVEIGGENVMRFFLPASVVRAGPPVPTDPLVHIVTLPPQDFAVLRFSGTINDISRRAHDAALLAAVQGAGRRTVGEPSLLSYDPPFALPFLRRNEVAVQLAGPTN